MAINKRGAKVTQRQKFVRAARDAGADEDEAAFKRKLEQLAKTKPKKETPDK